MSRIVSLALSAGTVAIGVAAYLGTQSWWKAGLVTITCSLIAFSKDIWAELKPKWVKAAAGWTDNALLNLLAKFGKHYANYLYYKHRTFDVKGFSTQGKFALELESVYVDLSVDPAVPGQISQDPIHLPPLEGPDESADVWTWLQVERKDRQHSSSSPVEGGRLPNFAIIGPPGNGKTTLVKHLALTLAARKIQVNWTPILLFLRDHASTIHNNPDVGLVQLIVAALKDLQPPPGWFERRLRRGQCLVMLDGLDEVAKPELRQEVVGWVERQVQAFGSNRFLVTSRPNGYRGNPLSGFTVLRVLPFNHSQVERFVRNWYLSNELAAHQKDDPGVRMQATEGADDLLTRLDRTPTLQDLAVNPLLLTLIATVHRYRSQLPGRRVELFAEICDVFLGKRQQSRGLELTLTPAQKIRVLRVLAYQMMFDRVREISLNEAAQQIAGTLALVMPGGNPGDFLAMVEDSSGLLVQRENGIYGFAHLTFQEYLASLHIKEEKLAKELAERVNETWWHETARLYSAQADPSPIIEVCLASERPNVETLLLAADCDAEALELSADLRKRLQRITFEAIEDAEPERRKLAAEHLLTRRIRDMRRANDDFYVDTSPVSWAEYQLFIDESLRRSDFRQPDYWSSLEFTKGTALKPVIGVRRSDAEAFCKWLSIRTGGDWTYSFPDDVVLRDLQNRHIELRDFQCFPKTGRIQYPQLTGQDVLEFIKSDLRSGIRNPPLNPRAGGRVALFVLFAVLAKVVDADTPQSVNLGRSLAAARDRGPHPRPLAVASRLQAEKLRLAQVAIQEAEASLVRKLSPIFDKAASFHDPLEVKVSRDLELAHDLDRIRERVLELANPGSLDHARLRDAALYLAKSLVHPRYLSDTLLAARDFGIHENFIAMMEQHVTLAIRFEGAPLLNYEAERLHSTITALLLAFHCSAVILNGLCVIERWAEKSLSPVGSIWLVRTRQSPAGLKQAVAVV